MYLFIYTYILYIYIHTLYTSTKCAIAASITMYLRVYYVYVYRAHGIHMCMQYTYKKCASVECGIYHVSVGKYVRLLYTRYMIGVY